LVGTSQIKEKAIMERNQGNKTTKSLEQLLAEHLNQEPITGDGSVRFAQCPFCNANPGNPAFDVNIKKGVYYCHCCDEGGTVRQLLGTDIPEEVFKSTQAARSKKKTGMPPDELYLKNCSEVMAVSTVGSYLFKRGISRGTWSDLDFTIKHVNWQSATLVYPFINAESKIVAIQKTFIDPNSKKRKERRYDGPKSQGIAILKKSERIIVAEGLETGLSVRQHLGNEYGLIVCGDAGNMARLENDHLWAIQNCKQVIVAADNDENSVGIEAARKIFFKLPLNTIIKTPSRVDWDWNDVLTKGLMDKEWV
jgi:phage/plasmid primase-like uncharacterized protein